MRISTLATQIYPNDEQTHFLRFRLDSRTYFVGGTGGVGGGGHSSKAHYEIAPWLAQPAQTPHSAVSHVLDRSAQGSRTAKLS